MRAGALAPGITKIIPGSVYSFSYCDLAGAFDQGITIEITVPAKLFRETTKIIFQ